MAVSGDRFWFSILLSHLIDDRDYQAAHQYNPVYFIPTLEQ